MLIVDGHNLTFADDDARRMIERNDPGGARHRVLDLVEAYAEGTRQTALVIFDGTGGRPEPQKARGRVRVEFSGATQSADEAILRRVAHSTGRRELHIVTSDRRLGIAARTLHAKTIGCSEFLNEVARLWRRRRANRAPEPRAKRDGTPAGEINEWLKLFPEDEPGDATDDKEPRGGKRHK